MVVSFNMYLSMYIFIRNRTKHKSLLLTIWFGLILNAPPAFSDIAVGDIYVRPLKGFNNSIRKTKMLKDDGEIRTNIVYGIEEMNKYVAVCGMVLHITEVDRRAFAGVMANSGIASEGKEFLTDLRYFREFIAPDQLLVSCRVTKYKWESRYGEQPAELIFRAEFQRQ